MPLHGQLCRTVYWGKQTKGISPIQFFYGESNIDTIQANDLKTILHSKRANIYYLEHCRVLVNGGRVEYITDDSKTSRYWNIPIANTTTVLLGTGTSITQAAVRELAKAGVMLGFCGGGGTPLFAAMEQVLEVAWLPPQSEYRPTEYLQHWVRFWFDDALRLGAAKSFQQARLTRLRQHWACSRALKEQGFNADTSALEALLASAATNMASAVDHVNLMTEEARLTKQLYKLACRATSYGEFTRHRCGQSVS
jgi:CRISP-associated protein Cas1